MQAEFSALIAKARTSSFVVEVVKNVAASPCDILLSEGRHVVAMQRQRLESFSTGRFERIQRPAEAESSIGAANRDFENIGRVIAMPKGYRLHVRSDGGITETVRCAFTPETLQRLVGRRILVEDARIAACLNLKCPRIARLLAQLAAEAEQPGEHSVLLIDALGQALAVELVRYLDSQARPSQVSRGGLSQRVLRQISEFTNARNGAVGLVDLSNLTGFSERHLTRAFKQSTGQTISEFLTEIRLKRAIEFLTGTNMKVREIAAELGFGGSGAFCVAFARETGESPEKFRKRQGVGQANALGPNALGPKAVLGRATLQ